MNQLRTLKKKQIREVLAELHDVIANEPVPEAECLNPRSLALCLRLGLVAKKKGSITATSIGVEVDREFGALPVPGHDVVSYALTVSAPLSVEPGAELPAISSPWRPDDSIASDPVPAPRKVVTEDDS